MLYWLRRHRLHCWIDADDFSRQRGLEALRPRQRRTGPCQRQYRDGFCRGRRGGACVCRSRSRRHGNREAEKTGLKAASGLEQVKVPGTGPRKKGHHRSQSAWAVRERGSADRLIDSDGSAQAGARNGWPPSSGGDLPGARENQRDDDAEDEPADVGEERDAAAVRRRRRRVRSSPRSAGRGTRRRGRTRPRAGPGRRP